MRSRTEAARRACGSASATRSVVTSSSACTHSVLMVSPFLWSPSTSTGSGVPFSPGYFNYTRSSSKSLRASVAHSFDVGYGVQREFDHPEIWGVISIVIDGDSVRPPATIRRAAMCQGPAKLTAHSSAKLTVIVWVVACVKTRSVRALHFRSSAV